MIIPKSTPITKSQTVMHTMIEIIVIYSHLDVNIYEDIYLVAKPFL